MKITIYALVFAFISGILINGCSGYSASKLITDIKNMDHFTEEVYEHSGTVMVMFYTVACPTCRKIKPLLDDLASKWKDNIKIVTVNCRRNNELLMKYNVQAVPRFMIFKDGEEITDLLRVKNEQALYEMFEKYGAT